MHFLLEFLSGKLLLLIYQVKIKRDRDLMLSIYLNLLGYDLDIQNQLCMHEIHPFKNNINNE